MDRLLYVAMAGAKATSTRQEIVANNLANVSTQGFKAQLAGFRTAPVVGGGALPTRAYVVESTPGTDFSPGVLQHTDRNLDIAIPGSGFLSVEDKSGKEAYTRSGQMMVNAEGVLTTSSGLPVLGNDGPITGSKANVIVVGQLKLVDSEQPLARGADGLFRSETGNPLEANPQVRLSSGYLEGSNVNAVDMLVQMISASRQFETQLKMIQTVQQNAQSASQLLTTTQS
jgi:flagellar basal-body rod protein FlgF